MFTSFVEIDVAEVEKHPIVFRYMKGPYNINLEVPKFKFIWDTGTVIKYLTNIIFDKLLDLSKKRATLTAVLCGQRRKVYWNSLIYAIYHLKKIF